MGSGMTYLDFAENDYMFFKAAYDNGLRMNTMASIGQNACEKYLKHIISEYANPENHQEREAKIEVLKLGADDFLLKPFNLEELQLKVERNIQKYLNQQVSYKKNEEFKNIILNQDTREVFVGGLIVYFTSKEFDILMLLIQNPNKVISKEKIFKEVRHEDYCIDTQTVTVHIKNIRKKIKEINPTTPTIETVWGIGFKIC